MVICQSGCCKACLVAPAEMARDILETLNTACQKALSGDLRIQLIQLGLDVVDGSIPEQFANYIRMDIARHAELLKGSGKPLH